MRTTIRLDEALLKEAKAYALRTGKTLTQTIEDALRESLARSRSAPPKKPVRLVVVDGSGLQPGVDLDDTASLLEIMDAGE